MTPPSSQPVEKTIEAALDLLVSSGQRLVTREMVGSVLRAFAREIQKPLEKLKADAKASQARTYSYAQAAERADDEVAAAESALLASQESARQLAEAIEDRACGCTPERRQREWQGAPWEIIAATTCWRCAALAAYRVIGGGNESTL